MSRLTVRSILVGVIALLCVPFATMGLSAVAAPAPQQLPTGLPDIDDLPGLPGDDDESPAPSDDPSLPIELPTGLPSELPTALPSEVPTTLPTALPTDQPAVETVSAVWISRVKKTFIGAVTSVQPLCQVGRTVVVKRIVRGKAKSIGRAETGLDAAWALSKATNKPGRYVAQVKPMTLEVASCAGDRSEVRRITR